MWKCSANKQIKYIIHKKEEKQKKNKVQQYVDYPKAFNLTYQSTKSNINKQNETKILFNRKSYQLYITQQNLAQNSLFCCYLYPKTHKVQKSYIITYPKLYLEELEMTEYTLACWSRPQVAAKYLYLSLNLGFSFSQISVSLSQSWFLNLGFSLSISISLSHQSHIRLLPTQTSHFSPIFSIYGYWSCFYFVFWFQVRGMTSFP